MKNKRLFLIVVFISLILSGLSLAQDEDQQYPQEEPLPLENNYSQTEGNGELTVSQPTDQNKISLDIKGMDIVDVMKMLATRSGMNIVVGKNVTGRVTLFLKDVDIWSAFEIILASGDLAYEKKGSIINVMTQRDYELLYGERYQDKKETETVRLKYAKAADLSRALNQMKTNIGRIVVDEASNTIVLMDTPDKITAMMGFIKGADLPVQTKVFSLNYAQADKISAKIQDALTKGVGSMKIDERTNKISVTDYPVKLEEIAQLITAFDEKTPQVLIDAQIIEIKPSAKFEMGVDWDFWIKKYFKLTTTLPLGTGTAGRLFLGTASATANAVDHYKTILDLLSTIGDSKILSSPRIMALNNQEAKIMVGIKDPYITSTTSLSGTNTVTSQSVNFVDTGIKLYVTPTINRDDFVTMKIKPEVSSAERTKITSEGQITEIPIVTTSEAETTVMVKDGVTVIIGGLQKEKKDKSVKKVPWIGDVPLLGMFFKSTSNEMTKTELVILLTPHIMSGESTFSDFSEIKPKDGTVARMIEGEIIKERISAGPQEEDAGEEENASAEYYSLVTDKVRYVVSLSPSGEEKGNVKIAFTLSRDGTLIGEPYIIETDNPALAPFVMKAIKEASPFPSFPASVHKEKETFKISLTYE